MKPSKCRVMCPDCGRQKMLFDTEKQAEGFIKFNGSEICDDSSKLRAYYCPACGGYHISSKEHKNSYEHNTENLINRYHSDIQNVSKMGKEQRIEKCFSNIKHFLEQQTDYSYAFKKPIFRNNYKYIKLNDGQLSLLDKFNVELAKVKNLPKDQIITLWSCILQQEKNKGNDMNLYENVLKAIQQGLNNALNECGSIKYNENDLILEMPNSDELYYPFTKDNKYDENAEIDSMARISKKQVQKGNKIEIYYQFGKNGYGISSELIEIGKDLSRLSKRWHLYLGYPHFDTLDDVYDFKVYGIRKKDEEINEGAWGYKPDQSDSFLDYADEVCRKLFKIILKDAEKIINQKYGDRAGALYEIAGLITDLLQCNSFREEYRFSKDPENKYKNKATGEKIVKIMDEIFEILENDDNTSGWDDFNKFKKELSNLKKLYNKRIQVFNLDKK